MKKAVTAPRPSISRAFSYTILLAVLGDVAVSAGASSLYMLLFVYAISAVLRWLLASYDSLIGGAMMREGRLSSGAGS